MLENERGSRDSRLPFKTKRGMSSTKEGENACILSLMGLGQQIQFVARRATLA
jgi:hypothetical protein